MSGSKSKVKDKNRSILNKEIVEISKYYLKSNVPCTVDVLRAGKNKKQRNADLKDLVNIQASNSVYVGGTPC